MGEVLMFNGITTHDLDANVMLKETVKHKKFNAVVILGYDEDGEEYFASSISNGADVLWLLERSKLKLLSVCEEDL